MVTYNLLSEDILLLTEQEKFVFSPPSKVFLFFISFLQNPDCVFLSLSGLSVQLILRVCAAVLRVSV